MVRGATGTAGNSSVGIYLTGRRLRETRRLGLHTGADVLNSKPCPSDQKAPNAVARWQREMSVGLAEREEMPFH